MDKYTIAPPAGSTNNSVGAADRPWQEGHFNSVKLNGGDLGEYLAESTGYGIVSGCEPSISGLAVTVGAGVVHLADGTRKEISATNITLDNADSTNPRIDLVYIDSTGTVAKVTGTAAASPVVPSVPANGVSVCNVSVAAGATTGTVTAKRDVLPRFYNTGVVNVTDFGAVGDGVHDDTAAIQAAIDSNRNIYFPYGEYLISQKIEIRNKNDLRTQKGYTIDGAQAKFIYTGDDYAFLIQGLENAYVNFGVIESQNGGNIELYSTGNTDYIQYVDIHFKILRCNQNKNNIYAHISDDIVGSMHGWIAEIMLYGGRFIGRSLNNIYISYGCYNWIFQHIGFESNSEYTTALYLDGSKGRIGYFAAYYCRHGESLAKLIKAIGSVYKVIWHDYENFKKGNCVLSEQSTEWAIYTPYQCPLLVRDGEWIDNYMPATLEGGTAIESPVDFDDFVKPGTYFVTQLSIINDCENVPIKDVGELIISRLDSYKYDTVRIIQRFITRTGNEFIRSKSDSTSNEWTGWGENLVRKTSVGADGTDFNDMKNPGVYIYNTYAKVQSCTNYPVLAAGVLTVEDMVGTAKYLVNAPLLQKYVTFSGELYQRTSNVNRTSWNAWKTITN